VYPFYTKPRNPLESAASKATEKVRKSFIISKTLDSQSQKPIVQLL
jgi:hypothetical protein